MAFFQDLHHLLDYIGARDNQIAQSMDPTVTVQGAFTGGGSNAGIVRDNQDRFELEDVTTKAKGAHAIGFGARLRLTRDSTSRRPAGDPGGSGLGPNGLSSSGGAPRLIKRLRGGTH